MEIEEGNKIIAKFMGYEYYPFPQDESNGMVAGWHKKYNGNGISMFKIHGWYLCRRTKEMRYCNSWEWLMPVIDKLEAKGCEFYILKDGCECVALNSDNRTKIIVWDNDDKLKNCYNAVLSAINWINS